MKLQQLHEAVTPSYYLKNKRAILAWLKKNTDLEGAKHEGDNYYENDDGVGVHIQDDLQVSVRHGLEFYQTGDGFRTKKVPFKFSFVVGDLHASGTVINSIDWLPEEVDHLNLGSTLISSFKGISKIITGKIGTLDIPYMLNLKSGLLELAMLDWQPDGPASGQNHITCGKNDGYSRTIQIINRHLKKYGPKQKVLDLRKELIDDGSESYL